MRQKPMHQLFKLLIVLLLAASLAHPATAEEPEQTAESTAEARTPDAWIIGPRTVPAPTGASDVLKKSIAGTPRPDVDQHIQNTLTTEEQWVQLIKAADTGGAKRAQAIVDAWSVTVEEAEVAGVTVRTVTPAEVDTANKDRLFVHLHGGAYVVGGGLSSIAEAVLIAHHAKIRVLSIDYRMPPAHPFPAAVEDVVAIWRSLLEDRPAASMALGGTSAGGGLTLASTQKFRQLGLDVPGALWAGTPWADLTKTGDSQFTNEGIDRALVTYEGILEDAAKLYADGRDLKTPLISPVYGDFEGFPPTYLVTGTRDLFLSDTVRVHRKMRVAGVTADLNVYEGMSHAGYASELRSPESRQVYGELGAFLRQHLK